MQNCRKQITKSIAETLHCPTSHSFKISCDFHHPSSVVICVCVKMSKHLLLLLCIPFAFSITYYRMLRSIFFTSPFTLCFRFTLCDHHCNYCYITCTHAQTRTNTHTHSLINPSTHTHTQTCTHQSIHTHTHTQTCTHQSIHTHTCTHTHTNTHTPIHPHTHTHSHPQHNPLHSPTLASSSCSLSRATSLCRLVMVTMRSSACCCSVCCCASNCCTVSTWLPSCCCSLSSSCCFCLSVSSSLQKAMLGLVQKWSTAHKTYVFFKNCMPSKVGIWSPAWSLNGRTAQTYYHYSVAFSVPDGEERRSLFVGCLMSQQNASVSQGRICTDNFTCCHTETEVADQTLYLTQSQDTDTRPTSPSADPIMPGAWQGSHWSANFEVTGMTRPEKNPGASGIRTQDLPLSRQKP